MNTFATVIAAFIITAVINYLLITFSVHEIDGEEVWDEEF